MIKYAELVEYIKKNHVNWNTDLFDVLKDFFEEYSRHDYSLPPPHLPTSPAHSYEDVEIFMRSATKFKEPENGEYTADDLVNLLST